jgi:hypothetical protein
LSIWPLDRPEDWVVGLVNEVQTRAEVEALRGQRHFIVSFCSIIGTTTHRPDARETANAEIG